MGAFWSRGSKRIGNKQEPLRAEGVPSGKGSLSQSVEYGLWNRRKATLTEIRSQEVGPILADGFVLESFLEPVYADLLCSREETGPWQS